MSETYVGPCRIPCDQGCEVPVGTTLALVPVPRHAWDDVIVCPHTRDDGETPCGRAFLVVNDQLAP